MIIRDVWWMWKEMCHLVTEDTSCATSSQEDAEESDKSAILDDPGIESAGDGLTADEDRMEDTESESSDE